MPKDRDQLTPDEPDDAGKLRPRRGADRVAIDPEAEEGPLADGPDPAAVAEVAADEKGKYH
jgi:hypothetical protein